MQDQQSHEIPVSPGRIVTLDVVRGVAVLGILAMNIIAFAMPEQVYLNPTAYGWESTADGVAWLVNFLFIDGRMRGLFSFLFGASMLLVIERAEANGVPSERIHFSRMAWLLIFGLVHRYLIWWGDILSLYAPIGMIAWFFHSLPARRLIGIGTVLILAEFASWVQACVQTIRASIAAAAPGASASAIEAWDEIRSQLDIVSLQQLTDTLDLFRGSYSGIVAHQLTVGWSEPITDLIYYGPETLGYMLFGMAALKTGFLTGAWRPRSYVRVAAVGFAVGIPCYALLAWQLLKSDFSPIALTAYALAASTLVRPAMIVATAALVILLARNGGALAQRFAAAGRAAFTNYLGTSIVMTTLFYGYGFGLYGHLSRAQLWLVVVPAWALMLLWSKPWLDRYRYGPFEWLWRSLARWQIQPMRRAI